MPGDDGFTDLPWIAAPEEMRRIFDPAVRRIRRDRKRMTIDDAVDIIWMEKRRQGVQAPIPECVVRQVAEGALLSTWQNVQRIRRLRREHRGR
ncbi:hypothetical protein QI633_08805 [Nocardioides sp. QY071]|uniref:hypothetical protein n=1 Tax=Nocardioides sp. QY071 TaxID=3044187 RepID=UPI00249C9C25|nr:hypothetical protein [Nocardioides sp. QY071]WGY03853.1 hypothetical protein QI633_08805 [Nocardioides sp. QY071]